MQSTVPLIRKLARAPICHGLSEGQVEQLFEVTTQGSAEKGSYLFREGELADSLLILLDGQVEVMKRRKVLATLGPGDVLGEVSLFDVQHTRTASVKVVAQVHYLRLAAPHFRKLVAAESVAALKLVHNLAEQMCKRLILANELMMKAEPQAPATLTVGRVGW